MSIPEYLHVSSVIDEEIRQFVTEKACIDLDEYPNIKNWTGNLYTREAVQKGMCVVKKFLYNKGIKMRQK